MLHPLFTYIRIGYRCFTFFSPVGNHINRFGEKKLHHLEIIGNCTGDLNIGGLEALAAYAGGITMLLSTRPRFNQ